MRAREAIVEFLWKAEDIEWAERLLTGVSDEDCEAILRLVYECDCSRYRMFAADDILVCVIDDAYNEVLRRGERGAP